LAWFVQPSTLLPRKNYQRSDINLMQWPAARMAARRGALACALDAPLATSVFFFLLPVFIDPSQIHFAHVDHDQHFK